MQQRTFVWVCLITLFVGLRLTATADDTKSPATKKGAKSPTAVARDNSDTAYRNAASKLVPEDPRLPRTLFIGDSIAMGYTLPVRARLKDKSNVHYPHENCHHSAQVLERIETYLGDRPWDLIHFNCGIHDITMLNEAGRAIKAGEQGKLRASVDEYRENLEKIVARLQKTGAALIWCSTTPVADNLPHRKPEDIVRYNAVAKEVMDKHGISIDDLHQKIFQRGKPKWSDGVHFTKEGSEENADDVAASIETALAKRPAKKSEPAK